MNWPQGVFGGGRGNPQRTRRTPSSPRDNRLSAPRRIYRRRARIHRQFIHRRPFHSFRLTTLRRVQTAFKLFDTRQHEDGKSHYNTIVTLLVT